jgi:hypothetical protein
MIWIRENELVIKNKVYHITNPVWIKNLIKKNDNDLEPICPCCKMECKYCEEKESRRKFIHKMVTGINDDNDTTEDKEITNAPQA